MSVCTHRPEPGGIFKECNPCKCSDEVAADQVAEAVDPAEDNG